MNNNQDNRNKKNGRESRDPLRTGLPLLALAVVIVLLFNWVYNSITAAQLEEKSYSDFLTMVQNNQLAEVQFQTDRQTQPSPEVKSPPPASSAAGKPPAPRLFPVPYSCALLSFFHLAYQLLPALSSAAPADYRAAAFLPYKPAGRSHTTWKLLLPSVSP